MPARERPADRGFRLAQGDLRRIGEEARSARLRLGLSLDIVGRAAGVSASQVSRAERGLLATATVSQLARIGAAVGLDVRVRTYPGAVPVRDAAHIALLGRLRARLAPTVRFRIEVPLGAPGDQRAWDAWLDRLVDAHDDQPSGMPVEAETRLTDVQAQVRRMTLKARDDGVRHLLLIVADTDRNRSAVRSASSVIEDSFPVSARAALAALGAGHHPGGSALVFL